jgi:molecular chaperone GrpE
VTGEISRAEILRRFEKWLDGALTGEEPPRGVEAEILAAVTGAVEEGDSAAAYSLWSAMTALTQEVKLQGRSFKELNETLGSQAGRMSEQERDRVVQETERRGRKEVLGVLIDLRDRLGRGLDSVRASEAGMSKPRLQPVLKPISKPVPRGWFARFSSKTDWSAVDQASADEARADQARQADDAAAATFAALKKGYELGLDRLDQALEEFNAREIPCEGQAFDPRRMNAIDRQESSTVPPGTVIEVYRSGYEWNGELFRPAQVKVACAPAGKENE